MDNAQAVKIVSENPELAAKFREEGKRAGLADGRAEIKNELKALIAAAGGDVQMGYDALLKGRDADTVAGIREALEAKDVEAKADHDQMEAKLKDQAAEIDRLKTLASGGQAVGFDQAKPVVDDPDQDSGPPKADQFKSTNEYADALASYEWEHDADLRARRERVGVDLDGHKANKRAQLNGLHKNYESKKRD